MRATYAQLKVLGVIAGGRVARRWPMGPKPAVWDFRQDEGIQSRVITAVVDKRWAKVGPRPVGRNIAPVELTEEGREVFNRG